MQEDLVSIVTPTYNSAAFIVETINSIRAQTYQNWELLITDDCSTDDTVSIIKKFSEKDDRIKLFILPRNSGAGVARNNSINYAKGRFIAFCDSDDRWLPDKLKIQVESMLLNNSALSYGSYLVCDENGSFTGIEVCLNKLTYKKILSANFIGCLTAIYDTVKVGKIFMPTIRKRQDWGLWIAVLRKCKVAVGIKQPIAIYRDRQNSISSNKAGLFKFHPVLYKEMLSVPLLIGYLTTIVVNMPTIILKMIRNKIINM